MGTHFEFIAGMITMGFLVASLFFLRFWRRTGDWLFIAFGIAFLLFALNQALVVLTGIPREEQSWIYLLRLAGFALLIVAIAGKNVTSRNRSTEL
jgi:hypothetical protein